MNDHCQVCADYRRNLITREGWLKHCGGPTTPCAICGGDTTNPAAAQHENGGPMCADCAFWCDGNINREKV